MSALENRIPPPLITTLIGLLMGASALFAPPFPSPTLPRLAAAAGLFLFGGTRHHLHAAVPSARSDRRCSAARANHIWSPDRLAWWSP